jgi:hypothetical protein
LFKVGSDRYDAYIEAVPNRDSPPAILLRESYREAGKVKKRTLLNLSDWPHERIAGFKALLKVLKGGTVIPKDQDARMPLSSSARCRMVMSADSGGSRPRIRDDLAHHSDLISLGVPG